MQIFFFFFLDVKLTFSQFYGLGDNVGPKGYWELWDIQIRSFSVPATSLEAAALKLENVVRGG